MIGKNTNDNTVDISDYTTEALLAELEAPMLLAA